MEIKSGKKLKYLKIERKNKGKISERKIYIID